MIGDIDGIPITWAAPVPPVTLAALEEMARRLQVKVIVVTAPGRDEAAREAVAAAAAGGGMAHYDVEVTTSPHVPPDTVYMFTPPDEPELPYVPFLAGEDPGEPSCW